MNYPLVFIVADRFELKLYQTGPGPKPSYILKEKIHLGEVLQAGIFPGINGFSSTSVEAWMDLGPGERILRQEQEEKRIAQPLARQIAKWLKAEGNPEWGLASSAPLLRGIWKEINKNCQKRLILSLDQNLISTPPQQFPEQMKKATNTA